MSANKGDEVHLNCPDFMDDDFYFLAEVEVFFASVMDRQMEAFRVKLVARGF
jgi:hypothetical protein